MSTSPWEVEGLEDFSLVFSCVLMRSDTDLHLKLIQSYSTYENSCILCCVKFEEIKKVPMMSSGLSWLGFHTPYF